MLANTTSGCDGMASRKGNFLFQVALILI